MGNEVEAGQSRGRRLVVMVALGAVLVLAITAVASAVIGRSLAAGQHRDRAAAAAKVSAAQAAADAARIAAAKAEAAAARVAAANAEVAASAVADKPSQAPAATSLEDSLKSGGRALAGKLCGQGQLPLLDDHFPRDAAYADFNHDYVPDAAFLFDCDPNNGGNATAGPQILAVTTADSRLATLFGPFRPFAGTPVELGIADGKFLFSIESYPLEGDPRCCPRGRKRTNWAWTGSGFASG